MDIFKALSARTPVLILLVLLQFVGSLRYYGTTARRLCRPPLRMMGIEVPESLRLEPGVVLVTQPGEHNHFLFEQAVFLYEYNQRGAKGVVLERPTAFSMGEMSPGIGLFEGNTLYTGGDTGNDMAIMLHRFNISGYAKEVGRGIFLGGIRQARELVEAGQAVPRDFKFFFNGIEWPPGALEKEITEGRWDLVHVTPDLILRQGGATTLWSRARAAIEKFKHGEDDARGH